jgi:hypothetical protein
MLQDMNLETHFYKSGVNRKRTEDKEVTEARREERNDYGNNRSKVCRWLWNSIELISIHMSELLFEQFFTYLYDICCLLVPEFVFYIYTYRNIFCKYCMVWMEM